MKLILLHEELIRRITGFVNGDSLNVPSRLVYPLLSANINTFQRCFLYKGSFLKLLRAVEREGFPFPASKQLLQNHKKSYRYSLGMSSLSYARILVTLYEELEVNFEKARMRSKAVTVLPLQNVEKWQGRVTKHAERKHFKPVVRLCKELKRHKDLFDVVLHGSCSTLDISPFSDVDCLLVLKRSTVTDPRKLVQVRTIAMRNRKYLDLFNPWNHHGFMVLSEIDLRYYRESMLPLEVYGNATASNSLTCHVLAEDKEERAIAKKRLINKCQQMQDWGPCNKSQLLDMIGWCNFLPTLYLGLNKQFLYKRDAFDVFEKKLKKSFRDDFLAVKDAWKDWPFRPRLPYGFRNVVHTLINPLVFKHFLALECKPLVVHRYAKTLQRIRKLAAEYERMFRSL